MPSGRPLAGDTPCGSGSLAFRPVRLLCMALTRADHRELFDHLAQLFQRLRQEALLELEHKIEDVVAVEEGFGLGPACHAQVPVAIRSMDTEPQPRLHRFELGRGCFVILTEPLKLIAKMYELFSPQRRAVVAAKRTTCHVHGRGQPVAVPVVGLVRVLSRDDLDSDVLPSVVTDAKRTAHLLRERLAVWVVAPAENL